MINAIDRFSEGSVDAEKMDEEGSIPPEVMQGLAELGLCGMAVAEDYGGLGLDYSLYSRVFAQIAKWTPPLRPI